MHPVVAEQIASAHRHDLESRAAAHRVAAARRPGRPAPWRELGARGLLALAGRLDPVVARSGDLRLQG